LEHDQRERQEIEREQIQRHAEKMEKDVAIKRVQKEELELVVKRLQKQLEVKDNQLFAVIQENKDLKRFIQDSKQLKEGNTEDPGICQDLDSSGLDEENTDDPVICQRLEFNPLEQDDIVDSHEDLECSTASPREEIKRVKLKRSSKQEEKEVCTSDI